MDVKWIKIVTDIFDDEKMLLIESMPDSDAVIVIWFKLLCLAGKMNNHGVFILSDRIPYTDEMLSTIFRRPVNTIRMALGIFQDYEMIEIINGVITIPNWEKHQSLDRLEVRKEYMKGYMREYREKQKLLCESTDEGVNSKVNSKVYVSTLEEDKNKSKKEKKSIYGTHSNVFLTKDEYQKLADDFGEEQRDEAIEFFSSYIAEKDYKSKSHYLSMRRWVFKAINERRTDGHQGHNQAGNESTEDDDRFYSKLSSEECDRILAEYEAEGI